MERDNGGKEQRGFSRNMYKGQKPKGGRFEGGRWGWRGVVRGKWRQLYLNNNKK